MVGKRLRSDLVRRVGFSVVKLLTVTLVLSALAFCADPPVIIVGFQAMLFNSKTGAFSADILGKDATPLGNVPAGEHASVSTFVIVKIRLGPNAPMPKDIRVRLVATESGATPFAPKSAAVRDHVILDQTSGLGPLAADGVSHVGFWLARTGCRSISLNATIPDVPAAKALKILPFACYE